MQSYLKAVSAVAVFAAAANLIWGQKTVMIPLDELLMPHPSDAADGIQLVVLNSPSFRDGTIEIELTGAPIENAKSAAPRGFVGLAFRLDDTAKDAPSVRSLLFAADEWAGG